MPEKMYAYIGGYDTYNYPRLRNGREREGERERERKRENGSFAAG
jgi:hypothetical protein